MKVWNSCISMLVGAAFLVTVPAQAQTTGAITVTVVDDISGQALEEALIHIPALELGGYSDDQGRFTLSDIPVGEHEVSVELIGFSGASATVAVQAGQTTAVELRLEPAAILFEETAVTGTAFKESPINLPYAVTTANREKLKEQGSPQPVDFFKNLSASHGVIGERSSWYNANQAATLSESIANVNLRGLGASRTLVLFNGRRQTYVPARLIGGRFVDVNAIPSIALDRVEVLKEGAAAIYGSDAVAGVANFITRSDFTGFEVSANHEYIADAGDTDAGAIWGGRLGSAHAVVAGEWRKRRELPATDRDYLLQPWYGSSDQRLGWSSIGNPGTFAVGAPVPWTAAVHAPDCEAFGGYRESWTCRFRYQQYENLVEEMSHLRLFSEINGSLANGTKYHFEGLVAQAEIPNWYTTPSYPPFPLTDTSIQEVAPDHPGRQAFCEDYGSTPDSVRVGDMNYNYYDDCQGGENWYFNGRPFGNSGPGRTLGRDSSTLRLAASANGDFMAIGGRETHFDLGLSYSRTEGNYNLPGVYIERLFLGFRGFGGPDCGVGVEAADPAGPDSLAGMRLGPLNGREAGQGDCHYYNPFSNAIEFTDQHGSDYATRPNPGFRPALANNPELRQWLAENEVDLQSTADMLVADATLTGTWIENVASYAAGYQFRLLNASGDPNDEGDVTINPCPVVGDDGCSAEDRFGPYAFTNVNRPYDESQTVHRFFAEIPLSLGSRFDTQLAANFEFHDVASSFDPKFGWRYQIAETSTQSLFLRGSVQTTFRTPSLDDVNESPLSTLEWINETGAYQTVDRIGSKDLKPERAFTYNAGLALVTEAGHEATFDYWSYDFSDVIGAMPHGKITELYADEANNDALKQFIVCPDGRGTGTCAASELERVQVDIVNWPGVKTSGIDMHLGTRMPAGSGQVAASLDGSYILEYETKALMLDDLVLQEAADAAGYLNFGNPIATSLPKLKGRASAGYRWKTYNLVSYLNYISSYEDRGSMASENAAIKDLFGTIDPFVTLDVSFLWNMSGGVNLVLSGMNLLDTRPPLVNMEQAYDGFTHDPKGRRLKLAVTYQLPSGSGNLF